MTPTLLIIPGLNSSGPDHWQTHWEALMPDTLRVEQADWEHPRLAPWLAALMARIDEHPDAILVAHSLGCALVANAVNRHPDMQVRAAMLVSPSDVDALAEIEKPLRDFAPMPLDRFPFPTIVVASRDDPYVRFERAELFASTWEATMVDVGAKGHVNADSGLGDWREGQAILRQLTD